MIAEALQDLAPVCRRIREAFAPHRGSRLDEKTLGRLERTLAGDLLHMHNCCYALARDIVTIRTYGRFAPFDFPGSDAVDEAAREALLGLFGRRSKGRGCLAIVDVVDALFEKNPAPTGEDIRRWLRGVMTNKVNNLALARLAERNPQYVKTARRVERYVRGSERYVLEKKVVRPAGLPRDPSADHMPTASEIVSLCGRHEPLPTNVPAAVDLIFELLAGEPRYRPAVRLAELRQAVFELLEARIDDRARQTVPITPYEAYLLGRAGEAAAAALEQARREYKWRGDFSQAEKNAFHEAGADYLFDLIHRGRATCSERAYLIAHLDGSARGPYEKMYKGSFHNFLRYLESNLHSRMGA